MKKVDSLTPAQEIKRDEYLAKWKKIGYSTQRLNRDKTTQALNTIYEIIGKPHPTNVIFLDSPYACQVEANKAVRPKAKKMEYESTMYAAYWTWWVGYYDFVLNEVFPEEKPNYVDFQRYAKAIEDVYAFTPYDNGTVFVSERPTELYLNSQGRLHKDVGPAMAFADGYSMYFLNGIKMPKEIVMAKPDDIDANLILKERNAEVRRELYRKLGHDRVISKLNGKTIDKTSVTIGEGTPWERQEHYELIEVDLGNGNKHPFLKMTNPSLENTQHIEPVRKADRTVKDALAFRLSQRKLTLPGLLT